MRKIGSGNYEPKIYKTSSDALFMCSHTPRTARQRTRNRDNVSWDRLARGLPPRNDQHGARDVANWHLFG